MPTTALRAAEFANRLVAASGQIVPTFDGETRISRSMLNVAMAAVFGAGAAEGAWTQRDSFQMLEMATLRWLSLAQLQSSVETVLALLGEIKSRLPTQTVRSEEQVQHQHFSTPLVLSWLAAHLADIQPDDAVLEPSSGIGMLARRFADSGNRSLTVAVARNPTPRRNCPSKSRCTNTSAAAPSLISEQSLSLRGAAMSGLRSETPHVPLG